MKDIYSIPKGLVNKNYLFHFLFNFLVFAAVYNWFGFNWLIVVGLADITRDLGLIVLKLYEKEKSK
jgi:hypothetical protein